MVFPYMDHDLSGLLNNPRVRLTQPQIKLYMKQLLEGTIYMHAVSDFSLVVYRCRYVCVKKAACFCRVMENADFVFPSSIVLITEQDHSPRYEGCELADQQRWDVEDC